MNDSTHKCAAPDCNLDVPPAMLMCKDHWFRVPRSIRNRVWAAYRSLDTKAHREAVDLAIEYCNTPHQARSSKITARPKGGR
jgi:hypothetical protein